MSTMPRQRLQSLTTLVSISTKSGMLSTSLLALGADLSESVLGKATLSSQTTLIILMLLLVCCGQPRIFIRSKKSLLFFSPIITIAPRLCSKSLRLVFPWQTMPSLRIFIRCEGERMRCMIRYLVLMWSS